MYEDKKSYLASYRMQNKKIFRLIQMTEQNPCNRVSYEKEMKEAERLKNEIEKKIAQTDGGVLSELLFFKYVCGKTLEETAFILHYSVRHTERLHQKALKLFPM